MMFLPSRDGFMSTLQEGRTATVVVSASDDIGVVVDSIRAAVAELGIETVRIWIRPDRTLTVEVTEKR